MITLNSISYIAVLAAAIAGMATGFLWYSNLLFAQKWMTLSKISPAQMEKSNMGVAAASGFAITLALSFCLAWMYAYCGNLAQALIALEFLILFIAIESLGRLIWEKIPPALYLINVGHKVVSWLVMLLVYAAVFELLSK